MILILQQMWYFNNTQTLLLLIDPEKSLCKPNISLKKTHGIHAVSTTKNQRKQLKKAYLIWKNWLQSLKMVNLNWIKRSKSSNRESNYPENVKKPLQKQR